MYKITQNLFKEKDESKTQVDPFPLEAQQSDQIINSNSSKRTSAHITCLSQLKGGEKA